MSDPENDNSEPNFNQNEDEGDERRRLGDDPDQMPSQQSDLQGEDEPYDGEQGVDANDGDGEYVNGDDNMEQREDDDGDVDEHFEEHPSQVDPSIQNDQDDEQNIGMYEDHENQEVDDQVQDNNQEEDQSPLLDESLQSYDENADFPVFANKINKKLNDIIMNYKKEIKSLNKEIEEDREMVKILQEHTQSVEKQVKSREKMLEEMTQNVTNQTHTIEVVKRQIGKVKSQRKELENKELSLQERFNILQQNIAKANEKMDSYKLNMKNILEELEQWALAARQKEDDKLNIEKYYRHDELKIKETMLQIEKLTQEVNTRQHDLEREATETQAAQIEMEKTTEELRRLQIERQKLLDELIKTQEDIKNLSDDLRAECDRYYLNKRELSQSKEELDKKIKSHENAIKDNKNAEEKIKQKESTLSKTREEHQGNELRYKELHNDIEIKKNELGALARELSNKTSSTNYLKNELEKKKKSLDEAKTEYNNKKEEIELNNKKFLTAKENEDAILKIHNELLKDLKKNKEELEKICNTLYEDSKELFDLREKEANMIGNINNVISAKKNLKANIKKLDDEITKQGELLYNVDFQIQLMERKVDWVQGKRTQEETNEINKKTEILEKVTVDLTKRLNKIDGSLIMINEDLRTVDTKLKTATEEKDRLTSIIEELELENMKCGQDLQKLVKQKEEVLVEHDLMKLDIKKIYDRLLEEANTVFNKENKLAQLELSIKEREKEINVHKEILTAEHKSAEEERHKTAMELTLKQKRAENLRLKYESLIQKNKRGDEEGGEEKYSQAYYVIKTAQEKEELQRQKDEMDGKIIKCRKDLKSLKQTLASLKERNEKLKKALIIKEKGDVDRAKVQQLEGRVEQENKTMWALQKEYEQLEKSRENGLQQTQEKNQTIQLYTQKIKQYQDWYDKQVQESKKKKESSDRAELKFTKLIRDKGVNVENSQIGNEIALNNEKLKNKYLKNSIAILSNEIQEVKDIFSNLLQDNKIPSRPISKMSSVHSQSSHNSSRVLSGA